MSDLKPTIEQRLDSILGIEQTEPKELVPTPTGSVPAKHVSSGNDDKDFNLDFDVARSTLHSLIEKGSDLTDAANYIAKEKQDAKSIEAAAMAQKEARDSALALIDLHQKKADIRKGSAKGGDTITQNNAVFVGTTGELLKLTRDLNKTGFISDALKPLQEDSGPVIDATSSEVNNQEDKNA